MCWAHFCRIKFKFPSNRSHSLSHVLHDQSWRWNALKYGQHDFWKTLTLLSSHFSSSFITLKKEEKGQFLKGVTNKNSFVPKDHFWKKNFYYFDFKPVQLNIYTADKPQINSSSRKNNVFTTTIALTYRLFEQSWVSTHTQSQRVKFSFKAPLKYKQNKRKQSTTFKRSSSHTNTFTKNTPGKHV